MKVFTEKFQHNITSPKTIFMIARRKFIMILILRKDIEVGIGMQREVKTHFSSQISNLLFQNQDNPITVKNKQESEK